MDKSKLTLASVKLVNGGMKGIDVEYVLPSIKGNVQFFDPYKVKRKAPVHAELEEAFSALKSHMLDICGYTLEKEEREYLMSQLYMTGIKCGDKGIILYANLMILAGTRVMNIETPLISDIAEYPDFDTLKTLAENIYAETKEYMAGKKVMSDEQIVARFNKDNNDFDAAGFASMSKEEQRDLATKILEEQGHVVFHNDEMVIEEPSPEKPKKERAPKKAATAEAPVVDPFAEEPNAEVANTVTVAQVEEFVDAARTEPMDLSVEASRSTATPNEVITLTAEDDDFSLPLVKTKKAKKTA